MGLLFDDDLHEEFATWALGTAAYGGPDVGEVIALADQVTAGDDDSFFDAFAGAAARLAKEGDDHADANRPAQARESYLHASILYAMAYHPLFGTPVDERLSTAFRDQMRCFDAAMDFLDLHVDRLAIPFEGAELPAYFLHAKGREDDRGPLLIATNGYDASVTEMYFATGRAAAERGYHCLLFDGPGQGGVLYEQGIPLRPDWETVVSTIVDFAIEHDDVDDERIALNGWSLGGYLALRAATGEHRLAACIADPGLPGIAGAMKPMLAMAGASDEQAAKFPDLDDAVYEEMEKAVEGIRPLQWRIMKRGYWAHGVTGLSQYAHVAEQFTTDALLERIACPTLLTQAENDPLAARAPEVHEMLRCPKTIMRFTAAEGAGGHCEMLNRTLLNRRTFDWLDATLTR